MFAAKNRLLTSAVGVGIPVAYDSKGAGAKGNATTFSFAHTAAAGADVFLYLVTDRQVTPSSIQYGGSAMTLVGSEVANNAPGSSVGAVYLYRKAAGGTGSSRNVTGSIPTSWWCAQSVAYSNVHTVGSPQYSWGYNTTLSTGALSCGSGQMLISGLGIAFTVTTATLASPTGGTNRYIDNNSSGSSGLAVSDSTTGVTFGASVNTTTGWAGVAVLLG